MTTKIQKWGNSSGIRIPKGILVKLNLENGSVMKIEETADGILIKPEKKTYHFDIKDLVKKITPNNQHKLIDWGEPVGEEIW